MYISWAVSSDEHFLQVMKRKAVFLAFMYLITDLVLSRMIVWKCIFAAGGRVESATPRRRDGDSDAEEGEYELSEDVSPDVPLEDDVIEELADETLKNEAKKGLHKIIYIYALMFSKYWIK